MHIHLDRLAHMILDEVGKALNIVRRFDRYVSDRSMAARFCAYP